MIERCASDRSPGCLRAGASSLGITPPQFLKAGDVVTLGIQGLGEQRQKVVAGK